MSLRKMAFCSIPFLGNTFITLCQKPHMGSHIYLGQHSAI